MEVGIGSWQMFVSSSNSFFAVSISPYSSESQIRYSLLARYAWSGFKADIYSKNPASTFPRIWNLADLMAPLGGAPWRWCAGTLGTEWYHLCICHIHDTFHQHKPNINIRLPLSLKAPFINQTDDTSRSRFCTIHLAMNRTSLYAQQGAFQGKNIVAVEGWCKKQSQSWTWWELKDHDTSADGWD